MPLMLNKAEAATLLRFTDRDAAYAQRRDARSKRSKYGNHKVTLDDGTVFDSKAEHRRWCQLLLHAKAGEVRELQRQVPYVLVPAQRTPEGQHLRPIIYIADLVYRDREGRLVVEDVKGAETAEWKLKRKLMLHVHGIWIREIRA